MRLQSNAFTRMLRTGQALALFCLLSACQKSAPPATQADHATPAVSRIEATARPDGSVLIKAPSAEFELSPRGYLQAFLVRDGRRVTLVHRPISSLWNRLAFVGLDGGEAFWGEGPDSPWWSR